MKKNEFIEIIKNNQKKQIFKFGAEWCKPCQDIKENIDVQLKCKEIDFYDIDIDESFDLFAFLKLNKIVSAIPVLLLYDVNNNSIIPNKSVTGTNIIEINDLINN